jgi:hypothetical protein
VALGIGVDFPQSVFRKGDVDADGAWRTSATGIRAATASQFCASASAPICLASSRVAPAEITPGRSGNETPQSLSASLWIRAM